MESEEKIIHFLHLDSDAAFAGKVCSSVLKFSKGAIMSINADSLEKALKLLSGRTFDAIVADMHVVDCFGIEIIQRFLRLFPYMPIIVLTDINDATTIVSAIKKGVKGYILKRDFSGRLLMDLLQRTKCGEMIHYNKKGPPNFFQQGDGHLSQIISNLDIGIVIVNNHNLVLYANPYAARLLSADIQKLVNSTFTYSINLHQSVEFELERNGKDKRTLEMRTQEIPWGEDKAYLVTLRDVSAKKQIETNMEILAKIHAENPNPFLRIDEKGMIIYANDAGAALMNQWVCTFFSTAPQSLIGALQTCARNRNKRVLEVPCGRKAFLFNIVPVHKGSYINLYGTDITQLKRLGNILSKSRNRYRGDQSKTGNAIAKKEQDSACIPGVSIQAG